MTRQPDWPVPIPSVGEIRPSARPNRRRICTYFGAAFVAALAGNSVAMATTWPLRSGFLGIDQRHLWIRQAGRTETLQCPFRDRFGAPEVASINALSWLFRDWRDHDQGLAIDVRLFDLLATVQTMLSVVESRAVEIVLTSGYRTPERNRTIEGAAINSQHIHGRAADIVVPGIAHRHVRDAAEIVGAPGLGRYPNFTHLDVGPPGRRWSG
jgi:uncharacterized protein YcbK (DUF882 family)